MVAVVVLASYPARRYEAIVVLEASKSECSNLNSLLLKRNPAQPKKLTCFVLTPRELLRLYKIKFVIPAALPS